MRVVAASPDGTLWGVGTQSPNTTDFYIYHLVNNTWQYTQGAGLRLAVGPDGTPYAVTAAGGIYFYQNGSWTAISGGASDISVGSDRSVYVISNQNVGSNGGGIWKYDTSGTWSQLSGAGVRIAASWDATNRPGGITAGGFYVRNGSGAIYYYAGAVTGYLSISGTASELAPTKNGGLFTLSFAPDPNNGSSTIWYTNLDTSPPATTQQAGAAYSITTNTANAFVVGLNNAVYESSSLVAPAHVQNLEYACNSTESCASDQNVNIPESWMATHVDWNEVDPLAATTSMNLASAGAHHIIVYTDPNITTYCTPAPPLATPPPSPLPRYFTENGANCGGPLAQHLTPQNGSYAHAYQHDANGNRLFEHGSVSLSSGVWEPVNIGDPDVRNAFFQLASINQSATDVYEDDAGGAYNCQTDYGRCDAGSSFGPPLYAPSNCPIEYYWCYKYTETAVEWDAAQSQSPQEKYLSDAIALSNASPHNIIGNNDAATNTFDLRWADSPKVKGVEVEQAWNRPADPQGWYKMANAALTYHNRGKYVVELTGDGTETLVGQLMWQIASHWIVYDPIYSVEFLFERNPATVHAGTRNDMTFPEETVVPTSPLVATPANNDANAFRVASGVYVREYAACFQAGASIGRCAAIVNTNTASSPLPALSTTYSHVLVRNTSTTWAAGGTAQWSTSVPTSVNATDGLILAQ